MLNIKRELKKLGFKVSNVSTYTDTIHKNNKQFTFDYPGCFQGLIRFDEYCEFATIEFESISSKKAHEIILYVPIEEALNLISIRAYTGNVYDGDYIFNEKTRRIQNYY